MLRAYLGLRVPNQMYQQMSQQIYSGIIIARSFERGLWVEMGKRGGRGMYQGLYKSDKHVFLHAN